MNKFHRLVVNGEWRGLFDETGEPVVRISGERHLLRDVDPETHALIHIEVIEEQSNEELEAVQPETDPEQHSAGTGQEQE